ncbi:MAG: MFS transporter [Streptosporangiales bacterium]|nr:MFS transporter [Streptosporangiales bacterium]
MTVVGVSSRSADLLAQRRDRAWRPGDIADLGVVTFSHAVQHVYVAALALTYPFVVADFGISYGTLGILLGAAGVVGGVLQAAAGMVRRMSARVLLTAQNLGLAVAALLGALSPGFAAFSAARMVGAFTSWPQHPVGSAYLTGRFPDRRGLVLSWHTTGGSIGTLAVPVLAGVLIAHVGWRWSLAIFALAMAISGVLVMAGLRGTRSGAGSEDAVAGESAGDDDHAPTLRLRTVLLRRTVVAALLASTIAAAGRGLGALTAYVPAYLKSGLHLTPVQVGVVFTVLVTGSVVGPVAAGLLSDRLDRRAVLLTVFLVGAAALAAFVLVGASVPALIAVGLLVGVFAYAESPLLQSLFSDGVQGANVRTAFGLYFAIAYGVGSLWLTALGAIIDHAGFRTAFFVMAGSFVVAGAVVLLARPDRPSPQTQP